MENKTLHTVFDYRTLMKEHLKTHPEFKSIGLKNNDLYFVLKDSNISFMAQLLEDSSPYKEDAMMLWNKIYYFE